jgi:hypothetical protein
MDSENLTGQSLERRNWGVVGPLIALMVASAVMFVVDLVRGDPLVGPSTDASLFAVGLVALLGRDQYARSVRPILRYVSQWTDRADYLKEEAQRFRVVYLRNVGPGAAVIGKVSWQVEAASGVRETFSSIVALYDGLARLDLRESRDYLLVNFTAGAALAPGEEQQYFACTEAALKAFTRFDAIIEFTSIVGDRYSRRVSLLPHAGAPQGVFADNA